LSGSHSILGLKLKAIQFESNGWNVEARRLLFDFYELLQGDGY